MAAEALRSAQSIENAPEPSANQNNATDSRSLLLNADGAQRSPISARAQRGPAAYAAHVIRAPSAFRAFVPRYVHAAVAPITHYTAPYIVSKTYAAAPGLYY